MKRLARFALNHLSRPTVQRIAGVAIPFCGLFMRGSRVECPVCGRKFRKFFSYGYVEMRGGALCPHCMSLERHRLLYLWLERKTDFFSAPYRLLHIAPEHCFLRPFERLFGEKYITADLESPLAKVKLDVQQMPFGDCEFDVVICNHILEHVDSDRKALEEIYRVMRHCGWGILLSPVDYGLESSYEDPTKTTPEERREAFGQPDHLRIFGRDYTDRLRAVGFEVEEIKATDFLTAEEITHYGIATDRIHFVRKL